MSETTTVRAGWVTDGTSASLRRAALRRLVTAFEAFRDSLDECDDYYEACAIALAPVTDRLLHELMELEGVPPYPHPMEFEWYVAAEARPHPQPQEAE